MERVGSPVGSTPARTAVQRERETQFARNMAAFIAQDFDVIDATFRSDVEMHLPGTSWLAGTYRGLAEVSKATVALRHTFNSDDKIVTFLHEGDRMIIRHNILVSGPRHDVEMVLTVGIDYDADGKFAAIAVQPDDIGLFDYVVNSRLDGQPDA
jgi:ketosteroid isomerase-like protein